MQSGMGQTGKESRRIKSKQQRFVSHGHNQRPSLLIGNACISRSWVQAAPQTAERASVLLPEEYVSWVRHFRAPPWPAAGRCCFERSHGGTLGVGYRAKPRDARRLSPDQQTVEERQERHGMGRLGRCGNLWLAKKLRHPDRHVRPASGGDSR